MGGGEEGDRSSQRYVMNAMKKKHTFTTFHINSVSCFLFIFYRNKNKPSFARRRPVIFVAL